MKRFALTLSVLALFALLPALPAAAQPGCPYQFPSCSSACRCNTPCFTPCCNGEEAKLCFEVLCQGQCLTAVSTEPAAPPLLTPAAGCEAPTTLQTAPALDLTFPALTEPEPVAVAAGE